MRKIVSIVLALSVLALVFETTRARVTYDPDIARPYTVWYYSVNARIDHSTHAEIVLELKQGDQIVLTGNRYDSDIGDDHWVEIQLSKSGRILWIVSDAVNWHKLPTH